MSTVTKKRPLTAILCCALLVALGTVLKMYVTFNITLGAVIISRVGFHLLTVYLAAMLFGPVCGMITGALVDFLSSILAPVGAYNPIYTLTLLLTGLLIWICYELLFKRVKPAFLRILLTVLLVQALFVWPINTLWTVVFYGSQKGFWGLLISRAPSLLFYVPVFTLALSALVPILDKQLRSMGVTVRI